MIDYALRRISFNKIKVPGWGQAEQRAHVHLPCASLRLREIELQPHNLVTLLFWFVNPETSEQHGSCLCINLLEI